MSTDSALNQLPPPPDGGAVMAAPVFRMEPMLPAASSGPTWR